MLFKSEQALSEFANSLGIFLSSGEILPLCIELVGDVGAGKTTFTRYLAKGLGIKTPVTSPSFTISKHYFFSPNRHEQSADEKCDKRPNTTSIHKNTNLELIHYDFYRLDDPGLMADNLAESLSNSNAITILEWADSVAEILPDNHPKISFKILPDGSRNLVFNRPMHALVDNLKGAK
ncbi:tRNA (adenosine(37)-N6)-threonylcarbamoyltransferase complex ATPase subunit type 1 TsaE [Candidatus Saccharibacteria bacterium]|nr:tRNA (adenosine(37)-N6)-threonylcarbamoyltransferase complex ATPase subunit type 1 TsaE [Candidatus Saccharibacteria bacterium]